MKYRYKRRPRKHQVAALKDLLSRPWGGGLLMDPRTGKTQVAIDFATIRHQQGKVDRVLVFCPVNVMSVWQDEIKLVCSARRSVTIWDRKARKRFELPPFGRGTLDFVIVNYDALSTPGAVRGRDSGGNILRSKTKGGRFDILKQLQRWQPQLVILDESHRIKSPSAKKTTAVWRFNDAEFRIIATGTAVTKKDGGKDIYAQWKFLDPSGWIQDYTFSKFKADFGVWRSFGNYDRFIKPKNSQFLRDLIHDDCFAVKREECFDLPASQNQVVRIQLSQETRRMYNEMAEDMIARFKTGELTIAQIKLVQTLRLAQLTSGLARAEAKPGEQKGQLHRVGSEKLDWIEDRLMDLMEADERVIVAARWRADLAGVADIGKKLKVPTYAIHGGMSRTEKDIDRKAFQSGTGAAIIAVQPQAGGLGIDLSTSSIMIWLSLTNSYVDWTQMCDRNALNPHRTYEYLIADGTYDEVMLASLHESRDVVDYIQKSPQVLLRGFK